ncbi:Mic27p NDAI_0F02650 [Naumovozyma dairenensis CBS 421]|uniref:Uncharacterized protein n=1 Tax=Naumovozyma dairenensis (strain ATCC 10597 / BCRC 20456 / CBS 421 / NBRC 0211 / NRRL Y-12639) TaxID=1071378 RepID=G0WCS2_NAUDC|nr:hypothetical protein NDAI_0F02650 [Naumovozyma dairenensis CBS 421]CCD25583.1 hypothetical protein NDAI_0F02650 [Naumovozyma dairenensis CBS 421]
MEVLYNTLPHRIDKSKFYYCPPSQVVPTKENIKFDLHGYFKGLTDINCTTLPEGNRIIELDGLTKWFTNRRRSIIQVDNFCHRRWELCEGFVKSKYYLTKDYLSYNIFNNEEENKNQLVPGSVLALEAAFAGMIVSNKKNWGFKNKLFHRNQSLVGKVTTSLPSRLILPWVLAGYTLSVCIPVTWKNFKKSIRQEPSNTIQKIDDFNSRIKGKLSLNNDQIASRINKFLQTGVRHTRMYLFEKLYE